ncbi:unnamed protein product [Adineta ricciae]|uniref:G-protein coupled receptors family 1 profile domain-containing protein n=1 Tax=Adineta ricciae TaxID=249248 RepID=A0A815M5K8_ADIRI|nr:unnamed protein product [Adineta ricciae]
MSSDNDLIVLFSSLVTNIHKYGGPILILIGTINCLLSLCVFSRKTLRKNPCSIYLIASNVSSIFFIYTSTLYSTLSFGYSIDPTRYNLFYCSFRFYTMFLFEILPPCYFILASIDRVFLTSHNALIRQKSTVHLAYISIVLVTLFWSIIHIHSFIFMYIRIFALGISGCFFQSGLYLTIMSYYPLIVKGILIPSLMIIFGLWTVKNIRTKTPVVSGTRRITGIMQSDRLPSCSTQAKDRLLIKILLIDIVIYIVFNLIQSIIVIYQQATLSQTKSSLRVTTERLVFVTSLTGTAIPFCIGTFTNLVLSKHFRREMRNALLCK